MKKERDAFIPMGFRDVEVVRCPPHPLKTHLICEEPGSPRYCMQRVQLPLLYGSFCNWGPFHLKTKYKNNLVTQIKLLLVSVHLFHQCNISFMIKHHFDVMGEETILLSVLPYIQ